MPSRFQLGSCYTGLEISGELGGGTQDYLPHRDGVVVCGCFRTDLNPDAPREILPAGTPDKIRWAETLADQKSAVPVFLKRETNRWECAGEWSAAEIVRDQNAIRVRELHTGRTQIAMILRLVEK